MANGGSSAVQERGYFLDGRWVEEGERVELRAPYGQKVIAGVRMAGPEQVESAIAAAVAAFAVTRRMPAYERQRILRRVSEGIAQQKGEFARTICLEAGKPIKAAAAEVERAIFTFALAAEEATRIAGELLPLDAHEAAAGRWGLVRRFALGPIAAITPFNFPLNLVAHKLAPAIAAGCPVVLKPAPQTPLSSLALAELVHEAGWPAGALSVLPLSNEHAAALVSDDRLKMLSFTGSAEVGWALKARAGKKRVVLELGGNAAVLVHQDADLDFAVERCVAGGFTYAGQSCISVQRILVHHLIFDRFRDALVSRVKRLRSGDPADEQTDVGPMIRERDAARAESWIAEAVAGGATLLCGGRRTGSMLEPTVITATRPEMKVNALEIFAPVVTLEPYEDFAAALRQVNDSPFGLQAGLFTRDLPLTMQAFAELEVGGVIANDVPTFRTDQMPYGGVKDSGMGREGLRYAIEEMTERKILVLQSR